MQAQVVLIPAESKKLIAMAVANMEPVKKAKVVVMHPSSSTYFLVEELTGRKPPTNSWVTGIIVPKGACVEMGSMMMRQKESSNASGNWNIGSSSHCWVVENGRFATGETLDSLLNRMGPDDVYIKGANALDTNNTVGVLIGNRIEGGSIGYVISASKRVGFKLIYLAGLEKLVPFSLKEAAKFADKKKCEYAMGIACSLLPCEGIVMTELKAIEILSGATAIPIAAGGIGGAEGAVVLSVNGESQQVNEAIKYIEKAKGARLPPVRTANCWDCGSKECSFPPKDKHWV